MDNLTDYERSYLITMLLSDIIDYEEKIEKSKHMKIYYQPIVDMNNKILDKLYDNTCTK